ncbi:VWA domain-containing protein [Euzebya rosea]|uniref:VWA domain-containing protein n=1 Tax=Euzebya rosea TaxID=2052804 RepID=UPI001300BD8B|nr:VWA domain-containing protein [Euzebya rosea]
MSLLAPLGLAAGALLGPLVLWYVLRSRRPRRVVASTLLFADEAETASAAIPWQRFAPDRTFWIIALALLMAALALARPAVAVPAEVSDHTIVVVDGSASMQATTADGLARIEHARAVVAELVDRAGDGRLVSVVLAGTHARVIADTLPASQAEAALDGIRADSTAGAMDEALTLAAAMIRPGEDTVLHLVTDGGISPDAASLAPRGTILDLVGETGPNLAIGAVRAVPLGGGSARLVVQVDSHADIPLDIVLTVTVDDDTVATRAATVDPRGRSDIEVDIEGLVGDPDGRPPVLEAAVVVDDTGPDGERVADGLAHDNRARVVLPDRPDVRILHVGPDNLFLDAALAAVPGVDVTRADTMPAALTARPDGDGPGGPAGVDGGEDVLDGVDLVVADRVDLPAVPTVPILAFAPTSLPDDVTVTGRRALPTITRVDTADPLLADADLSDLAVAEMDVVEAPSMRRLVDGPGGPLLLAGRVGDASMVLLPFALADSNLPLQVGLPVLVANAVQQLAAPTTDVPLTAGADRSLPLPTGVEATLTSPDGATVPVGGFRPSATLDTPGVWTVAYDGTVPDTAPRVLAVNPDTAESDLAVVEPALGTPSTADTTTVTAGEVAQELALPGDTALATDGRIELWRWFAAAAAALVGLEVLLQAWAAWQVRGVDGRTVRRPDRRQRVATGMRVAALLLLVATLLDPAIPLRGRDVDVVFVVDASASMGSGGQQAALEWVRAASVDAAEDDRIGVVLFGRDAQVAHRLLNASPSVLPPVVVREDGSDMERAVRLAGGLLGRENRRRVVLLTDGRATQGNLDQAAALLAETGIGLDVVRVGEAGVADVLVEAVEAPASVRQGEAYPIDVVLRNDTGRDAEGVLVVRIGDQQVASQQVQLPPGTSTITVDHVAGDDPLDRITAELRSGESTVARNDTGQAAVRVAGPPRVLMIADDPADADPLAAALEAGGVTVEQRPISQGLPTADRLLANDAIVLVDVAAPSLGTAGMTALDAAVRDGGVGLVAVGGEQSFGLGDYTDTSLEDLLPVSSRITDPLRRPRVAEALVVDSSESMGACHCADEAMGGPIQEDPGAVQKTEIARQAVRRAVQALESTDTVGVLAFDTQSHWVLPLQQVPESAVVEDGLAQLQPSGNTDIPQAIRVAIEGLRGADAELRHIVLFSDGFMGDLTGLGPVADEALDAGITLSVVGTGEGSFDELEDMARRGGGRYYPGRDLSEIPEILAAEVMQVARPLVSEGSFVPTVTGLDDATEGLDSAPPLLGFVATTAKPTARRLLTVGEFADPLLATWQVGAGTATAWTSDAAARWSAGWVGWGGYQSFWADVVKDTFPDATGDTIDASATAGPGGLDVTAQVPANVAGTTVTATVVDPDGVRHEVELHRDDLGGFSGTLPAEAEGVHLVSILATDGAGEPIGRATVPAVRAYPAEFGAAPADDAALTRAAEQTGGLVDPAQAAAFRSDDLDPGRRGVRIRSWLLVAAMLLAVAEVGVRRLRLERGDLRRLRSRTADASRPSSRSTAGPSSTVGTPSTTDRVSGASGVGHRGPPGGSPPLASPGPEPSTDAGPPAPPPPPDGEPTPTAGEPATGLAALRRARDKAFDRDDSSPW